MVFDLIESFQVRNQRNTFQILIYNKYYKIKYIILLMEKI